MSTCWLNEDCTLGHHDADTQCGFVDDDGTRMVRHEGGLSHSEGLVCDRCPNFPHTNCISKWAVHDLIAERLAAVAAIHVEGYPGAGWCAGCHDGHVVDEWPCATLDAVNIGRADDEQLTARLRLVLEQHGYRGSSAVHWCTCNNVPALNFQRGNRPNIAELHRRHLAEQVVSALRHPEVQR